MAFRSRTTFHSWTQVPPGGATSRPRLPGCYAVYVAGELVYIGSCLDFRKRLTQHKFRCSYSGGVFTPWGVFEGVVIKIRTFRRFGEWLMVEARLIRRLHPRFNVSGVRRAA
jgi:excinuclease UvrABC nuclease subunit